MDKHTKFDKQQEFEARKWRLQYRLDEKKKKKKKKKNSKKKTLSLQMHPKAALEVARPKHRDAQALSTAERFPGANRQPTQPPASFRTPDTFEVVAREWHDTCCHRCSPSSRARALSILQRDLFPHLGGEHISDITAKRLASVIRKVESRRSADTARRARIYLTQVFRHAIGTGWIAEDPCNNLHCALPPVNPGQPSKAIAPERFTKKGLQT